MIEIYKIQIKQRGETSYQNPVEIELLDLNNPILHSNSDFIVRYSYNIISGLVDGRGRIQVKGQEDGRFFMFRDPNANNCDGIEYIVRLPDNVNKWDDCIIDILNLKKEKGINNE